MPPVGFELTISAGERPKTYTLDRADPGTGSRELYLTEILVVHWCVSWSWSVFGSVILNC